jgi:hypothetical protein
MAIYKPKLYSTVMPHPNLGRNPTRWGEYVITADNRCQGTFLIRWGTGARKTRGGGFWRVTLPVPAKGSLYKGDPSNAEMIGSGIIGIGLIHTSCTLHFNTFNGGSLSQAILAPNGGLFAGKGYPSGPRSELGNIHGKFDYVVA